MKPPGNFLEYTWFPGDSLISENCQYQYYRSISSSSLPNICGLSQIGGTCVNISRYLTGFLRAKWVIIVNLGREAYLDFGHPLIWITKKKKKQPSILNPKSSKCSLPILDSLGKNICKNATATISWDFSSCTWYIDSSVALSSCTSLPQLAIEFTRNSKIMYQKNLKLFIYLEKSWCVPPFCLEYRTWQWFRGESRYKSSWQMVLHWRSRSEWKPKYK